MRRCSDAIWPLGGSDFLPFVRVGEALYVHTVCAFSPAIHYPACRPTAVRCLPRQQRKGEEPPRWSEEEDEEAGVAQAAVEVPAEQQHASTQHWK